MSVAAKVTVVVPIYNAESYLAAAIATVIRRVQHLRRCRALS